MGYEICIYDKKWSISNKFEVKICLLLGSKCEYYYRTGGSYGMYSSQSRYLQFGIKNLIGLSRHKSW